MPISVGQTIEYVADTQKFIFKDSKSIQMKYCANNGLKNPLKQ